ncbi:hypothetical protein HVE50_002689 [Salmonella enterica]|nr:hypothetical protein [Salmonella enterica]ELD1909167.1 hypothetical protein [Salmonella enterica]
MTTVGVLTCTSWNLRRAWAIIKGGAAQIPFGYDRADIAPQGIVIQRVAVTIRPYRIIGHEQPAIEKIRLIATNRLAFIVILGSSGYDPSFTDINRIYQLFL